MLSFFETPSSLSASSDITTPNSYQVRYEFPCGILESIELFCLILFVGDAIIKVSLFFFLLILPLTNSSENMYIVF